MQDNTQRLIQKAKAAKVRTLAMHAVNCMGQKALIEYARLHIESKFNAASVDHVDKLYAGLTPGQKLSTYPVEGLKNEK